MPNQINEVMSTAMNSIKEMVDVNTVIGDAVQTPDGTVIIPVCKVCFGIASGGGEYKGSDDISAAEARYPFAGGCAAGVSIIPTAFLKSGSDSVQLLPVDSETTLDRLVNMIPDLLNKITCLISHKACSGEEAASASD